MSRIIHTEVSGKTLNRLTKLIVLSLRELMQQTKVDMTSKDLVAFITIALLEIEATVESSVSAWEKRDYWVKADRFRMQWEWSGRIGGQMRNALLADDWQEIARLSVQVGQKLNDVKVAQNHRMGKPWIGAFQQLNKT